MQLRSYLVAVALLLAGGTVEAEPCVDYGQYVRALTDDRSLGPLYGVDTAGDRLFLARFGELIALDISDPVTPVQIGSTPFEPGRPSNLLVAGGFAYVAQTDVSGAPGLSILDVSDPSDLRTLGKVVTADEARDVALAGSYALVAVAAGGVQIVDISDPTAPAIVSSLSPWGSARGISVLGDYALVAEGKLRIYDVSDPSQPVLVSSVPYPGVYWKYEEVNHDGDPSRVVVGLQNQNDNIPGLRDTRIAIIDVTNVYAPVEVGSVPCPGVPDHIRVRGHFAYVAYTTNDSGNATKNTGLQIIDIGDPTAPATLGMIGMSPSWSGGVALHGDYAFLAQGGSGGHGGFQVVDISNPRGPDLRRIETPAFRRHLIARAGLLYTGTYGTFEIRDANDPQIPVLSTLSTSYQSALHAPGDELVVLGTFGLTPSGSLHFIDVATPTNPDVLAELALPVAPEEIVVDGSLAYVASFVEIYDEYGGSVWAEFYVVDVSNPSTPVLLSTIPGFLDPYSIAVAESHVFVGTADGVHIVDVSDPLSPAVVGFAPLGNTSGLAVQEDILFASVRSFDAGFWTALVTLSLVDPADPLEIGRVHLPGSLVFDLLQVGNTLYVANARAGVQVVNATDPAEPVLVGGAHAGFDVRSVALGPANLFASETVWANPGVDGILLLPPHCGSITFAPPLIEARPSPALTLLPNPFVVSTHMEFTLGERSATRLCVFDVRGRFVANLVDRVLPAGAHRVTWDGRDSGSRPVTSGVYWVRLESGDGVSTKKAVCLR